MGIRTLISVSNGLDPYFFRLKKEKTRSVEEEMDGRMFVSRQSRHFSFMNNMNRVLLLICTSNWRVDFYVSRQGKDINRRNESTIINKLYNFVAFGIIPFEVINYLLSLKIFPS